MLEKNNTCRKHRNHYLDSSWYKLLKFNLVGLLSGFSFWILYEILYLLKPVEVYRVESSWAVAYFITSIQAHFLHFKLTFKPERNYLASLWRTLLAYSITLIASTISEYYLVSIIQIHHRLAWLINAFLFGILNFILLRYVAYRDVKS